jgi:hypothetical protein
MKRIPAIIPFLVFVSAVFIGILIYVYVECKKANPEMIQTAGAVRSLTVAVRCRAFTSPDTEPRA